MMIISIIRFIFEKLVKEKVLRKKRVLSDRERSVYWSTDLFGCSATSLEDIQQCVEFQLEIAKIQQETASNNQLTFGTWTMSDLLMNSDNLVDQYTELEKVHALLSPIQPTCRNSNG